MWKFYVTGLRQIVGDTMIAKSIIYPVFHESVFINNNVILFLVLFIDEAENGWI